MSGLRRFVDRFTPLDKGCEARPLYPGQTYKGSYWRGGVIDVIPLESRIESSNAPGYWEITGYRLERTRAGGGFSESRELGTYNGDPSARDVVRDLLKPKVIARVDRVEKIARKVKRVILAAGAVAAGAFVTHTLFSGDIETATNSMSQISDFLLATGTSVPETVASALPPASETIQATASLAVANA